MAWTSASSVEASASTAAGPPNSKRVNPLRGTSWETFRWGIARSRESIILNYMFPGFPPEALKFLRALKRNNDREWFQPRKEIFDTKVRAPMEQLVEAINAELLSFAPEH